MIESILVVLKMTLPNPVPRRRYYSPRMLLQLKMRAKDQTRGILL